jgi:hypothetical protein
MRKKITIRNPEHQLKTEKIARIGLDLNGKTISELNLPEILLVVEYLARRQNLVDESDRIRL